MKKINLSDNMKWCTFSILVYIFVLLLMRLGIINSYYEITLITIGINIILAVSLNLIIGLCGQFSLGHAGFMCIGAYAAAVVLKFMPNYIGLLLGIVVGVVISSLVSLIVAIPTLRLKGDYLAIATLGFSEIIRIIVLNMNITGGAAGLGNIEMLTNWHLVYFGIVLTIIIVVNFKRSAAGRACISIREDEIASEAMGINTTKYKVLAFVIGAALASFAGAYYSSFFYFIKPDGFGIAKSIDILVIVVFGGIGSITGSVISAIVLGIITTALQSFAELRMIIYALMMICIMIFKPGGLLGKKELSMSKSWFKKKEVSK